MSKLYNRLKTIYLPNPTLSHVDLFDAIINRFSYRKFTSSPISLQSLSNILYFSSGIKEKLNEKGLVTRMYPSAGGKFPLEVYVLVQFGLDILPGVYHYSPETHSFDVLVSPLKSQRIKPIWKGQKWFKKAAAIILLSADYRKTTSKYGQQGLIFPYIEAGHIGQNIALVAEANQIQSCSIGQLNEPEVAKFLDIQIDKEPPIYYIAVGN